MLGYMEVHISGHGSEICLFPFSCPPLINHKVLPVCEVLSERTVILPLEGKTFNNDFCHFLPNLSSYLTEQVSFSQASLCPSRYVDESEVSKYPKCIFKCVRYTLKSRVQGTDAIFTTHMAFSTLQLNFLLKRVPLLNQQIQQVTNQPN